MIARFHYDQGVFRQLLNDELEGPEEQDVTEHIESCVACQDTLESVSKDQVDWDSVSELLKGEIGQAESGGENGLDILSHSDNPDSIGRFGRYEVVEFLGRGGMGLVLKAYDSALNRYSAIKVLAPVLATSASARKRFAREAKSAAAVVHEHVVPIQTVDEENGLPYFVMPVIDGQSLQQRVDADGPLELREVLRIGMQIASGLSAAHAQGLVHRDVKPANVLLENGVERVMLTDFGLARAADDANMTQSGVITGTPQYMSPEQAQGLDVDHTSDLFSLGSVLYFMCTGRSPFRAKTTFGVLNRIIGEQHRPLQKVNSDVPTWLSRIVDRLLSKDTADRYDSAAEVRDVLASCLAHLQQPEVVPPPAIPATVAESMGESGRNTVRNWLVGAAAGGVLLLAGILISIETNKGTLTVECPDASATVRVMQEDKVVRKLSIERGATSTRIAAGQYTVEIDGPVDGLEVRQGNITLSRGGAAVAKIVEKEFDRSGSKLPRASSATNETRVEFLEGTDIAIVRGRKDNVLRLMDSIGQPVQSKEKAGTEKGRGDTVEGPKSGVMLKAKGRVFEKAKTGETREGTPKSPGNSQPTKASSIEIPKDAVVFLEADWCLTAAVMAPTLDRLRDEGFPIVRVDIEKHPDYIAKLPVKRVPGVLLIKDGMPIKLRHGVMSDNELRDFVEASGLPKSGVALKRKLGVGNNLVPRPGNRWEPWILQALSEAAERYDDADLMGAKALYEQAFGSVGEHEIQPEDHATLIRHLSEYAVLLAQVDEEFPPAEFPLQRFVEVVAKERGYSAGEVDNVFREIREGTAIPQRRYFGTRHQPGRIVVLFESATCAQCQKIAPEIQELAAAGLPITRIDVNELSVVARKFGIDTTPTLLVLQGDREVAKLQGASTGAAVRDFIEAELLATGDQD